MAAVDELVAASAHTGSVEILVALRLSADSARTVNNRVRRLAKVASRTHS